MSIGVITQKRFTILKTINVEIIIENLISNCNKSIETRKNSKEPVTRAY